MLLPKYLYGIIGFPLGHSLSPLVHNTAFADQSWPGSYFCWPIRPDQLENFMHSVRHLPIHGLSVTIPHKQAIIPYLDQISDKAARAGAVNTVYWQDDKLMGENTDIYGFMSPLHKFENMPCTALILGAGGAARAAIIGLQEAGCEVTICNRTAAKSQSLAEELGAQCIDWNDKEQFEADLLVNTTPLGMQGERQSMSAMPVIASGQFYLVYDIVYNPLQTNLLETARRAGCKTISGLDMFTGQAQKQFELWTGLKMGEDKCRERILNTL